MRPVRPSWWAPLVQWWNWPLLVKLAAVLMVPALLAVALGVVQIQGDVARANSYADMQRLVTMRSELRTLLETLQMERTMTVEQLGDSVPSDPSALRQQTRLVDHARTAVSNTSKQEVSLAGVAANRYRDATGLLTRLPALRAKVASGHIASWTALNDYSTIVKGLLNLDQALFSPFSVPQLSRSATTLYDLEAVEEQIHLQHVLLLQAVGHGHSMTPTLMRALQESDIRLRDGLDDFRTVATPAELGDYQRTVSGSAVSRRAQAVSAALAAPTRPDAQQSATSSLPGSPPVSLPVSVEKWNHDSENTGMLVIKVADDLTHTLHTTSAELQDQSSNRAGVASLIVFAVLLLALAIGFAIGRHLLRSLTVLRTTALDVAERRLPAAVASILEGEVADAAVDVVPVHTTEEFGQLARAFDTVHSQAVRLAAEQAGLRGDLRNTLVNLSRRSQSLVDRLLLLMEQLERREEDPDQLGSLFTLDHLATRMRRNNENMMVLCGSTLVRSSHQRVALDSVLRGAVSEIERYQRVLVQPGAPVDVIGYAAGDLGRLVAELLDNATAFSPPQTQVLIGCTRESDSSVLIEIQDEGIGMSESDLATANQRMAVEAVTDTPASRQLGLLVVGRLANRHGIAVNLSSQPNRRGLRARVHIPGTLVNAQAPSHAGQRGALTERPTSATAAGLPGRTSGSRINDGKTASLPRRPLTDTGQMPAPAGKHAPRQPEPVGLPWFAEAASASATTTAAPGTGNAADTPVAPAEAVKPVPVVKPVAAAKPVPVTSSPPHPPGDREPTPDGPAPALPVRRPAARAAQKPEAPTDLTGAGLPRRLPPTPSTPPARAERPPAGDGASTTGLDAGRAHSFLSSYQAGLRRARPEQTQNPSATGRKKP
jgi:signal transduction histidine kinase